ncbi:MAG: DEAD/DEAH box helicase [Planctomycetota bacterium]
MGRAILGVLDEILAERGPGTVVAHRVLPAAKARTAPLPPDLRPAVVPALASRGVTSLYTHQRAAYDHARAGRHVVVVTPTASGKTLCYNLPILQTLLEDPGARALYLFPTKALARDQAAELGALLEGTRGDESGTEGLPALGAAVYDGDTPPAERTRIRDRAHVVLSNPDMLHTAILPHHARWMRVFENLRYVVIDELHHYRGVFGSHLANVLRRLERICRFHGSRPTFVCTSATIANAKSFAETLLERPVEVIEENGAPLGERHLVLLNPPLVQPAMGLRASYLTTAKRVAERFLRKHIHTIVFCGARTVTEVMAKYLKEIFHDRVADKPRIVGYRGGYLPKERRAIERGLREGSILGVVSTNALELGVDIGSLDACVLAGYPGTIASTRQQAGRAGRRQGTSVAVLVLRSAPLDQYLADHPEFLLDGAPESAHINADNLQILVSHLKCAAFELPLEDGERFGRGPAADEEVPAVLAWLEERGVIRHTGGRWHWAADAYPANDLSLRSVTSTNFVVVDTTTSPHQVIAEVDYAWAFTTLHEGAIYMVQSVEYHVDKLDWERRKAYVRRVESEYYTDALSYARVKILHVLRGPVAAAAPHTPEVETTGTGEVVRADEAPPPDTDGSEPAAFGPEYGEVEVVRKAVGYKKIKFHTQENLGWGSILLPEDIYHTQATWLTLPQASVAALAVPTSDLVDALQGLANLLHGLASFLLMCDGRDLGVVIGDRTREWFHRPSMPGEVAAPPPDRFEPTIFLYDQYSGGIGLAEALHPRFEAWLGGARDRLRACACARGCPSCVGPEQEVGPLAKRLAVRLLDDLLARAGLATAGSAEGGGAVVTEATCTIRA